VPHATTVIAESRRGPRVREEPAVNLLVIAWYPHEPNRVGEIAVVPNSGSTMLLGRDSDAEGPLVRFFRPRPGQLVATAPLLAPGLSRKQLEIEPGKDAMRVKRVGQCPMRINGRECDEAIVRPGDTIRFRQELLLLFLHRPARIAPLQYFDQAHAGEFGEPDAAGILGESPQVWEMRDRIGFAAKAETHVLLVGESGTGKELAARALHRFSARAKRPFVARNAATLPSGLIDAELFGNARNYPNPGMAERPGLIGQADGGFLFLDEIGELSTELQAHLLRVLDAGGEYQRLGESNTRQSDFRFLGATNRDPSELKHDLIARLAVQVALPALENRREDIPLLVRYLIARAAEKSPAVAARFVEKLGHGMPAARVDAALVDGLTRRAYDGNTRELDSILWAAMSESQGGTVSWHEAASERPPARPTSSRKSDRSALRRNQEPSEEEIRAALEKEGGNVARAATALGMTSRYALYRVMAKLAGRG
jgi:DNA-binding NtrC family response regulator